MFSERTLIAAAFIVTCVIWGSTWLVIRIGLATMPPFFSAGIRFLIALPFLYGYMKWQNVHNPFQLEQRWLIFVMGIFSFGIAFGMVYWGEQYVPSGLTSILFAIYPFVVAIFQHLLMKNATLTLPKTLGIVCGFIGIVVIFYGDFSVRDSQMILGMIMILLSAVIQGFVVILIKKYGHDVHPFSLNFGAMSIAAPLLLLTSFIFERDAHIEFTSTAIFSILYLALIGSIITFASYYWLLKRIEAVYLSLIAFVTPILAVFLGAIVLNEKLELKTFLGAGIVLSGILIANSGEFFKRITRSVEHRA
ncbi:MAG: multidrug DMT transporter permease [Ignavibacteria bacterium]|nr:multidrug DMT transporter permease [Ignavibacteria bacterium]